MLILVGLRPLAVLEMCSECTRINHQPRRRPSRHNPAATRKEAVQPKRAAIAGVSEAVTAPPICAPIFMKPETEPDACPQCQQSPTKTSSATDTALPAPPASTTLATRALSTWEPKAINIPASGDAESCQAAASQPGAAPLREPVADGAANKTAD